MSSTDTDSSSSSSDDSEPVRRIAFNIRPKEEAAPRSADASEIRASMLAWLPAPATAAHQRRAAHHPRNQSESCAGAREPPPPPPTTTSISLQSQAGSWMPVDRCAGQAPALASSHQLHLLRSSPSTASLVNGFGPQTGAHLSPAAVPVALAFQESIELQVLGPPAEGAEANAEPRYECARSGSLKMAFSRDFAKSLGADAEPPPLKLCLRCADEVSKFQDEKGLLLLTGANQQQQQQPINNSDQSEPTTQSKMLEFDMSALASRLGSLYLENPFAKYYNLEVLRYQLRPVRQLDQCPLQVCAYWQLERDACIIKLRIDYRASAPLRDVAFQVNLANLSGQEPISSKPLACHAQDTRQLVWRFSELAASKGSAVSSLLAKIQPGPPPTTHLFRAFAPPPVELRFLLANGSLSRLEPQLQSPGYRLTLVKREVRSARYQSHPFIL